MDVQNTSFVAYELAGAMISTSLALYAWRHRDVPGAAAFALMMLATTQWTLAYSRIIASPDQASQAFWIKAQYIGIMAVPAAWLAFVLAYTGRAHWLDARTMTLLSVVPALTVLLAFTNEGKWMWAIAPSLERHTVFGAWFWVQAVYNYCLVALGLVLLVEMFARSSSWYRWQIGVIAISVLVPAAINAMFVGGLLDYDVSPYFFPLSGLGIAWGLFRYRLLDVVPVARDVVIEKMNEGVIVLDTHDRIVDANPAAQDLIGRPASELIGRPAAQAMGAWPELVERYIDVIATQAEITLRVPGGLAEPNAIERTYDLRITPLADQRGRLTGRVMILHDITEHKKANEELAAFADTVAHDLKNPVGLILGFAKALTEECAVRLDPAQLQWLQAIARNSLKMQTIIDELLLLANVRRAPEVELHALDMAHIVAEAQAQLAYMIDAYQATIVLPQGPWPIAVGYAPWVEGVWVNYISNAIKYGGRPPRVELGFSISDFQSPISDLPGAARSETPALPKGPSASASASVRDPKSKITFWVRDNGPGLEPDKQARLFTPFTQLDQSRAKGHGLGLSIVQRVVDRLGGQVSTHSQVGQGSTFWFTLPAAPGTQASHPTE